MDDSSFNAEESKEVDDVGFLAKSGASLSAGVIGLSASVLESFTRNYVLEPKVARRLLWRMRDQLPILAIITITVSFCCDASYATSSPSVIQKH